jgi:hypothetical protein
MPGSHPLPGRGQRETIGSHLADAGTTERPAISTWSIGGLFCKMDDRAFWVTIRRALLMVIAAIERRWGIGE